MLKTLRHLPIKNSASRPRFPTLCQRFSWCRLVASVCLCTTPGLKSSLPHKSNASLCQYSVMVMLNHDRCPLPDVLPKCLLDSWSLHAAAKQEEEELKAQKKKSSSQSNGLQKQQGGETPPASSSEQPRAAPTSSSEQPRAGPTSSAAAGSISLASWSHQGIAEKAKEVLLHTCFTFIPIHTFSSFDCYTLVPFHTFSYLFFIGLHALIYAAFAVSWCTLRVKHLTPWRSFSTS